MKIFKLIILMVLTLLLIYSSCPCPAPVISSITPASGPGGTIVEVEYTGGGITGTIIFNGVSVETRAANSTGLGNKLRFTVPYHATTGVKNVEVSSGSNTSAPVTFTVTNSGTVPVPVLVGFEIGHSSGNEITVYGSNFSTLSKVYIDGTEVSGYSGASLPFREIPFNLIDNIIIARPQTNLLQGSTYNVQVRNPNGNNSATLVVTIPNRVIQMEFDAVQNVPIPDYYVWQNNTVNTFRRSYSECGWIIDFMQGDTAVVDPFPGTAYSYADCYSFWQANANVPASGYYMQGMFVADGPTDRGVMYMNTNRIPSLPAANYRQGFACFWDDFAVFGDRMQKYLRTSLHESGHGFNLYHSDASVNQTIMTVTPSLAPGWHCFFSNISCSHLATHNIIDVAPGGTAWAARTCH